MLKHKKRIKDYKSFDSSEIKNCISLLVLDSEASTTHLKLLSKLAVQLLDLGFRDDIIYANTKKEVVKIVNKVI